MRDPAQFDGSRQEGSTLVLTYSLGQGERLEKMPVVYHENRYWYGPCTIERSLSVVDQTLVAPDCCIPPAAAPEDQDSGQQGL